MPLDLPLVWAGVLAFAVFMYVLLDGFDLGIGILFRWAPGEGDRDRMMTAVAPVWDGNETWLVLGGTALLAAFPVAYAVVLPALYLPLIVMLIALIFRGVAFEFRIRAERSRFVWDHAFHFGSLAATFAQGVVLGAYVRGIPVEGRRYAGGPFDWLSPFSLMTGLALVAGYALLGATWLILKTEGGLQDWAYRTSRRLLAAVVGFMAVVSLWVPLQDAAIARRWFSWPNIAYLSPVPLLVGLLGLALWRAVTHRRRHEAWPFLLSMGLFLLGYAGLAISLWPNVVPPAISIRAAASPPATQAFLLAGIAVLLPLLLGYTAWSYWVFRGKVGDEAGYH